MVEMSHYVRAGDPSTPVHQLKELLSHESSKVRRRLAENPATPTEILSRLAEDGDPEVRIALVKNPSTPRTVVEQLASEQSIEVRYGLAADPSLPADLLKKLAADDNPYVAIQAQKTIDGLAFEAALTESNFMQEPGDEAKLGELLLESQIIDDAVLKEMLFLQRRTGLPIGRLLAQAKSAPRHLLVLALNLQAEIRRKNKPYDLAIRLLKETAINCGHIRG